MGGWKKHNHEPPVHPPVCPYQCVLDTSEAEEVQCVDDDLLALLPGVCVVSLVAVAHAVPRQLERRRVCQVLAHCQVGVHNVELRNEAALFLAVLNRTGLPIDLQYASRCAVVRLAATFDWYSSYKVMTFIFLVTALMTS